MQSKDVVEVLGRNLLLISHKIKGGRRNMTVTRKEKEKKQNKKPLPNFLSFLTLNVYCQSHENLSLSSHPKCYMLSSSVCLNYFKINLNCFHFESKLYNLLKESKTFQQVKLNKIQKRNLSFANYYVNFKCPFKCGELCSLNVWSLYFLRKPVNQYKPEP